MVLLLLLVVVVVVVVVVVLLLVVLVVVTILQKSTGTSRGAPTVFVGAALEAIYDFFLFLKIM